MKYDILIANVDKAKEEIKAFNNWQGHACINYDIEDGEIWTDVFTSDSEWKEYHSPTIIKPYAKDGFHGRNGKASLNTVAMAIKAYANEYGVTLKPSTK